MRMSPGCGCCGPGPTIECQHCSDDTAPEEWEVEFSGIANDSCANCESAFNDTFILPFISSGSGFCLWRFALPGGICDPTITWLFIVVRIDSDAETVEVDIIASFGNMLFQADVSGEPHGDDELPICNWTTLDLPFHSQLTFGTCDASGATCTIRRV